MSKRPFWHTFFMKIAKEVSQMSTCASGRKVGAVFVRDKHILATGFNGVPAKYPHPTSCARKEKGLGSGQGLSECLCAHAETNGIANAAQEGVSLKGSTAYVTTKPCANCAGMLVNAGVKKVYYEEDYDSPKTEDIFNYAGVRFQQISKESTWV